MFRDYILHEIKAKSRRIEAELRNFSFEALPEWLRTELVVNRLMLRDAERATHYFLEVDQASELRDLALDETAFPRAPHAVTFVEFDGALHYDYDHIMSDIQVNKDSMKLKPFRLPDGADYRGVLIRSGEVVIGPGGLLDNGSGLAPAERVLSPWIQAHWFDRRGNVFSVGIEKADFPKRNFDPKGFSSEVVGNYVAAKGPGQGNHVTGDAEPEEWNREEGEHLRQMYRVTVNLLHFLMAENLVFVKVRPEHRREFGERLRGLPKSDRPYRIVSFQAARLRYEEKSAPAGRHVGVRFDVRGFFRHLKDERYGRDAAGAVRTTWVQPHQRGIGAEVYRPKLRVGHVGASVLDFDEFYREAAEKSPAQSAATKGEAR